MVQFQVEQEEQMAKPMPIDMDIDPKEYGENDKENVYNKDPREIFTTERETGTRKEIGSASIGTGGTW
jgi:hypothetical protein